MTKSDHIITCEDLEGKFVSRNHIFRKGTSRKLKTYAEARKEEMSQGGESKPSVYSFAMDTSGSFCDTAILFLKKIAVVKFSDEPGSEPLLAWKRANWVQETCLLIQATLLRTASFYFHRGLQKCFPGDYAIYLTVLLITDLTIIRPVAHPPTFRPPVDDATILHCRPVKDFYRK